MSNADSWSYWVEISLKFLIFWWLSLLKANCWKGYHFLTFTRGNPLTFYLVIVLNEVGSQPIPDAKKSPHQKQKNHKYRFDTSR